MSKNNDNKLVPKLRFPEFEDKGDWKLLQIGDVLIESRIPSLENNPNKRITVRLNQMGIEKRNVRGTESEDATYFFIRRKGQFIYGKQNLHKGAFGIIPNELDGFESSQDIPSFDFKKGFNPYYFLYYLGQDKIYLNLEKISIGTGSKRIHPRDLYKVQFPFPKPEEQQKIAACLSSLDEVITAESQKLDLLKEHKKGLLQNLFPQEGETVPNLRFKEFENCGEWEETTISEIGEPLMCKRIFKEETTPNPNNGVPFYKIGTFGRLADSYISKEIYEEYKSKYSFPKVGDILISASGTIGRLVIYDGSPAYFQDSNIIWLGHNEEKVLNRFLFYCYTNLRWQTSDGGVISRLYNSDFKRMTICFPENQKEQEKIADTLSSLDDLINAQSQKIEALKLHKKGLLQGLFPEVNEENPSNSMKVESGRN